MFSCKSQHTVCSDLQMSLRRPAVYVALWELRSIFHHRPTFHNGSNLYGPVLALSAAGQNTQGIRAEYIPLSDTGSHCTVSFPFRLYALGNEGFSFSFPLLRITYWNPAVEEWFKHSLVHFCSSCSGPLHTSLLLRKSLVLFFVYVCVWHKRGCKRGENRHLSFVGRQLLGSTESSKESGFLRVFWWKITREVKVLR